MKKNFVIRIAAIALFCLGTLAIKSESPSKGVSACTTTKCNKKDSSQCEKKTTVQTQKKTTDQAQSKKSEKVITHVSSTNDFGHDAFFIKI
jgi:hypothetical protein